MQEIKGRIAQIVGPVVDVAFRGAENVSLPSIHDALDVLRPDGRHLVLEVQQHIGEDTVRCVAMDSAGGWKRYGPEAL